MRKQLFYLNNQQLTAFGWRGGTLVRGPGFGNDEAGRTEFGAYLAQAPSVPSYLLVDVVEEDFQRDTAPHVSGRARVVLLDRKLAQLYRETPFRHATLQGRDTEGRKDDRYLLNALTNAELPKSWLAVMQRHAVPLAGMYSLSLLSQVMCDKLKPGSGPVLLVSHQSSGLRQSFFDAGLLRFSRLTPLFDHAPVRLAEAFRIETAKTRQFMASTRLLARGAQVTVVVLASADNLQALQVDMVESAEVRYLPMDSGTAGRTAGLGTFDNSPDCDPLYIALLAGVRVPSHFALRDQRHFYQLLQARMGLYTMSGVVALGALAWTANDASTIIGLRDEQARLQLETAATETRYQTVIKNMPVTQVSPHNMKSVVDLEAMITNHVPLPAVQLAEISAVLEYLPELKIRRLHWQAREPASVVPTDPAAPPLESVPAGDFPPPSALLGVPDRTAQVVMVEGDIVPFSGNYRAALVAVNQLAAQLNRNPKVRAEVTVQPIDTRPAVRLESSAGATVEALTAPFAVKVTWMP